MADLLLRCIDDVDRWMLSNRLKLNADKTDIMWCATSRHVPTLPSDPIVIAGAEVWPVPTVRDLGVLIDSDLGSTSHVHMVVARCFAALRQLRLLRRFVNDTCFRSLIASLVNQWLDYGNFVLFGSVSLTKRWRSCIGCAFLSGLATGWRSWRSDRCMVSRCHI